MGKLIDGEWITDDKLKAAEAAAYKKSGGQFQRSSAGFRHWFTADGGAGRSGRVMQAIRRNQVVITCSLHSTAPGHIEH